MRFRVLGILPAVVFLLPALFSQTNRLGISNALIASNIDSQPTRLAMTVRKEVQEVNLILNVTDRRGHFVHGLQPSDLTILDNNQPQTHITFFQSQTNLPLRIALLLDVSSSVTSRFDAEQYTINSFLRHVTRPRDSVVLYAFNQGVRLVAPITGNWKEISHRVKKLKPGGETALYDAVSVAAQQLARDFNPARKIMIVISDGEENASKMNLDATLASVLRAETVVYAVNVGEDRSSELARQGEATLKQLSDATGGAYLHADVTGDVGSAFSKIRKELRSQYAVAYRPSNLAEQLFHQLNVIAVNLRVRCRRGYYARASN